MPPSSHCLRILRLVAAASVGLIGAIQAQTSWVRGSSGISQFLSGLTHGAGVYAAVGEAGTILTSPDSITWSQQTSGTTLALRATIFADGIFVTVGQNGTVLTSPDGSTWTTRSSGTSSFLSGIAHGSGTFVAVGGNGVIVTSTDGMAWTIAASGTNGFLQNIEFCGGIFVASGSSGGLHTSPDATTWSAAVSPTTATLIGSGCFDGKHYVVGQNGTILSSADAITWSVENSGVTDFLRGFATDGTSAIVCGDGGIILQSFDGATWTALSSGQSGILSGVGYADDRFVVVGEVSGASAVILSGDRDPGFRWESSAISVSEAAGSANLSIRRLGDASSAVSIDYSTIADSATGDVDFTLTSGTASFGIGESSVPISIPLANNPESEPAEFFAVQLSSPEPASMIVYEPRAANVKIIDAQDSDFDGLPDDWEILHFGDVESYGPSDDPDMDGNSNAVELADGTEPDNAASANYRLLLGVASGIGIVTASPALPTYPRGTEITLTPTGSGAFVFDSWQVDAGGSTSPLVFSIQSDTNIEAIFTVSLEAALDDDCLSWTTSGTGASWFGQGVVSSDGQDAAEAGGLSFGQQSSIEAQVHGPAQLAFRWKVSTSQFDSFRFFIDGSPRASSSGSSDWQQKTFFIGAGTHTIKWTYAKNSGSSGGSNQAWIDEIQLSYGFEYWQLAYFNASERADLAVSGTDADPDADGTANLLEFLLDLHPKFHDSDSVRLPSLSIEPSGGQEFGALTWSQHEKRAQTIAVAVEFSTTLENESWQEIIAPTERLTISSPIETVRVTNPLPYSTVREFYRLRARSLP